jgi:hypothetical protein
VTPTGVRRILNNAADRALATPPRASALALWAQVEVVDLADFRDLIATHRHA